jgi:hypothetical protein
LYQTFFCYNKLMIRTANRQFRRNRNFGNGLPDMLRNLASAGGAQLIIRSNVTPEIRINVADLAKPGTPPKTAVQGDNAVWMNLIKPEVVMTGLGVEKSLAPYGKPTTGMFTMVAVGAGIAAALGGLVAWKICRG